MTAPLFYSPVFQALDVNGDPLPGAYLQFYLSGTTTPTDVYADGDLVTPLSNPVVANAAGRFVPIYLDPTIVYRVQLFDEFDLLIYDVDPFFPLSGNFVGEIKLYFGLLIDVPAGWSVCDGTLGTPDMRGLFAIGVSGSHAFNSTGGAETATGNTGAAGAHDHGGVTGGHALIEAENGPHGHTFYAVNNGADSNADGWLKANDMAIPGEDVGPFAQRLNTQGGTQIIANSGSGTPHTHTITAAVDHVHSLTAISILPPFRALYYLMFTG